MIMQRVLTAGAALAFVGGVVVTILFAAGVSRDQTAAIAFVLGGLVLTAGIPLCVGRAGKWGVPHDLH